MINLWQKFIDWKRDYFDSAYLDCKVCQSCGEEGCCPIEQCLLNHGCKYGEYYAREVYYNKMIIDEFHNKLKELGYLDELNFVLGDDDHDINFRAFSKNNWVLS